MRFRRIPALLARPRFESPNQCRCHSLHGHLRSVTSVHNSMDVPFPYRVREGLRCVVDTHECSAITAEPVL